MLFTLPKDWNDEERMNFLFQPFGDRNSNPYAYDSKMKFWKDLVVEVASYQLSDMLTSSDKIDQPVLFVNEDMLRKVFSRKGKTPRCLRLVIEALLKEGTIEETVTYREGLMESVNRQRASWSSWGYQVFVSSPVRQLTKRVVAAVSPRGAEVETINYVVKDNVKEAASKLLTIVRARASDSHTGSEYRLILTSAKVNTVFQMKDMELNFVLLWLEANKRAVKIGVDELGEVYKFTRDDETKLQNLTEVEQGVLQIEHAKDQLETKIAKKQLQVDQYLLDIKTNLAKKNRPLALRILRKKKVLEKGIDNDMEHVDKLEGILDKIYVSSTNQLVLQAYGEGAKVLKSLSETTPVDRVQATMDSLSEGLAANEEIGTALAGPLLVDDESEEDLERELKDLLAENPEHPVERKLHDVVSALDKCNVADHSLPSPSERDEFPKRTATRHLEMA